MSEQMTLFRVEFNEKEEPPEKFPKETRDAAFDLTDALQSPIITWPSPWQADIPAQVLEIIPIARMAALIEGQEMATLPEVVAYMMPRTMESPLDRDWANIYLYVAREYMVTYRKADPSSMDFAPAELDDYETDLLTRLRVWIYQKRRGYLKERFRAAERVAKKVAREEVADTEMSLF